MKPDVRSAQAGRDRGVRARAASLGAGFLADRVEDHDQQRKEDDESVHGRSTAGGRAVLDVASETREGTMIDGDILPVEVMARREDWSNGVSIYLRQRLDHNAKDVKC